MCSVYTSGSSAQYAPCSSSWFASSLQNGGNYVFAVFATDGVGNIGSPLIYQWTVGETVIVELTSWSVHSSAVPSIGAIAIPPPESFS